MNTEEWVNKKVRISLRNGFYYKGLVLSTGEDFIKIRDFRDTVTLIRIDQITIIEEWKDGKR